MAGKEGPEKNTQEHVATDTPFALASRLLNLAPGVGEAELAQRLAQVVAAVQQAGLASPYKVVRMMTILDELLHPAGRSKSAL